MDTTKCWISLNGCQAGSSHIIEKCSPSQKQYFQPWDCKRVDPAITKWKLLLANKARRSKHLKNGNVAARSKATAGQNADGMYPIVLYTVLIEDLFKINACLTGPLFGKTYTRLNSNKSLNPTWA